MVLVSPDLHFLKPLKDNHLATLSYLPPPRWIQCPLPYDALSVKTAGTSNIIDKYDPEGELDGTVGIFPVSYVEDHK